MASTLTTPEETKTGPVAQPAKLYGLIAEFETPGDLMVAAEKCRDAGFKYWDCHTPFPCTGSTARWASSAPGFPSSCSSRG